MEPLSKYLKQPYPFETSWKNRISITLGIGFFVFAFLFVFQPFGIGRQSSPHFMGICLGYGLITAAVTAFNQFLLPLVLPKIFTESGWTALKEICFALWHIFTIGLGNLFYSALLGSADITLAGAISFQGITLVIGLFPISALIILEQNRLLKKHVSSARNMNANLPASAHSASQNGLADQALVLEAENGKETLSIPAGSLLFIRSVDNYVEVHWNERGKLMNRLLRGTLKGMEAQLKSTAGIFRCHRTFLINTNRIEKVVGNSQGYKLLYGFGKYRIPVSRNYAKVLLKILS